VPNRGDQTSTLDRLSGARRIPHDAHTVYAQPRVRKSGKRPLAKRRTGPVSAAAVADHDRQRAWAIKGHYTPYYVHMQDKISAGGRIVLEDARESKILERSAVLAPDFGADVNSSEL
jgi:hypothetical protein